MNISNEQQPITTGSATSTEKTSKRTKNMAWLYILLAIGVITIVVGVVLVFLLK